MSDKVVKGLRKSEAVIILMILAMCLIGCKRKTTEYQDINITENKNDQEIFEKGYNLPISQSDMDQAKKETEELLDCIENLYQPYLDDETITLTVNAVCEMVLNDEAIITHELTVKENADGSFMYMGNKILDDGINLIPVYQYRIGVSQVENDMVGFD